MGRSFSTSLWLLAIISTFLCLGFVRGQIDDGTCGMHRPYDATFDCTHGADCMNTTCYCLPGYTNRICGYGNDNCMCIECVNGNMTNAYEHRDLPHYCECEPGWTGKFCDICASDDICKQLYPDSLDAGCDKTPVMISQKNYDCNVTDPFFQSLFPEAKITYRVRREGMNETQGKVEVHIWVVDGNPRYYFEMFYCMLSQCTEEGSEDSMSYKCLTTSCGFTGTLYVSPRARPLIEGAEGLTYVRCKKPGDSGMMDCVFYQNSFKDFFGEIPSICFTGECYNVPRSLIEQPFNPVSVIVVSGVSSFLLAVVFVSMYLYRKKQKSYFAFSKQGDLDRFIDLTETISFENDILEFTDVCYTLEEKIILDKVSGYALPGEVLAIIGGSGAGKTTLLDILAQRVKRGKTKGIITVNGEPIGSSFYRITSYVDQEPAAIGTQTVRELLMTAAHLRLPELITLEQKKKRVLALVSELGIDHILDRRYGEQGLRGISGGEKRRVQIACQLITGPSIVFLDEPTSGLDSYNALSVCRFLKNYAQKKNRTVIMSIHQPRSDIYQTFDKLMVLAGGRNIYFGKTSQAKQYFQDIGYTCPPDFNPADFILDVAMSQSDSGLNLEEKFKNSEVFGNLELCFKAKSNEAPIMINPGYGAISSNGYSKMNKTQLPDGYYDKYATSFWTQVKVLSGRSFSDMYRYPLLLRLHLFFAILSAVLMGLFFFNLEYDFAGTQNRFGLFLFLLIVLAFGSMSSIGFLDRERDVFTQERASGAYHPAAYFLVKLIYDLLPLRLLPAFLTGTIVYMMANLQKEWLLYGTFIGVLMLFNVTTTLICMSIATSVRNMALANLLSIITLLFFMLFQGIMINFDSLPLYLEWMTFLSPFRFALNSLLVNEFDGLTIYFDPLPEYDPEIISGRLVLTMFGFIPEWAYSIDLIALGSMVAGWALIALLSLSIFVKETR